MKTIEKSAFSECYNLTEIDLPEGLETIGENAFNLSDLEKIYCRPLSPPVVYKTSFPKFWETIYVPRESVNLYKNASSAWEYHSENIVGYDF